MKTFEIREEMKLEKHPVDWVIYVNVFDNKKSKQKFGSISLSANELAESNCYKALSTRDQAEILENASLKDKVYYTVRPTLSGENIPLAEGTYRLESDNAWIDTREDYRERNILRVANAKFTKLK